MRIAVVGSPGSGKSTLAARLARAHGVPHVELDALYWGPGWRPASDAALRARVAEVVAKDAWVIDGNYAQVRDLVWARVDRVVWLDLSLGRSLWRVVARSLARAWRAEPLWNGNRERLTTSLFARDSLFWWTVTTFAKRRATYAALAAAPGSPPIARLRTPADVEACSAALASGRART